MQLLCAV